MRIALILILFLIFMIPKEAVAQDMAALETQVKNLTQMVGELKTTVDIQQREIADLKKTYAIKYQPPAPQPLPQPAALPAKFTPEIGAVADIVAKFDSPKNSAFDEDYINQVDVRELELVLGSNVDPYSRLDATIAFSEKEGVDLEEAYLTRFGLPFDTTARIGRFLPKIGKALPVHRDSLDTVDEPLVIQRYFGEEGMFKSGVDLTKILDLPLPSVHQVTIGVLEGGNGEGGTAFGPARKRPTLYGHLKNYLDITDVTNFELGVSDALGSNDDNASFKVNVLGVDATLRHIIGQDQEIKLQSEAFYMKRREEAVFADDGTGVMSIISNQGGDFWGGYALFDARLSSRWGAGLRFDYVQPVDRLLSDPRRIETGITGYLTFYQSEFARLRAQISHTDPAGGEGDTRVFLQGTFAIGEHKHKLQ